MIFYGGQAMIEKIQAIVNSYGLNVVDTELITKGFLSENFKVVCQEGIFFLKQYRAELDKNRVQDIHKSKNFFAGQGIPAVMPIANGCGEFFVSHEGRFFALFPFVNGHTYPDQHCSISELRSLARMLARVHLAGETAETDYVGKSFKQKNKEETLARAEDVIVAIEKEILRTGGNSFDRSALRIAQEKQRYISEWPFPEHQPLPHILVHYDLHAGNVFFDDAAEIQHVFDFELVQHEPAAFDVVRTMTIVCMDYGLREEKWNRVHNFLDAYREVRALSDEELYRGVIEFVKYRSTSFWVEEEHYLKNNSRVDRFLECDEESRLMWIEWLEQGGL
jgi:homoserine kinase type II